MRAVAVFCEGAHDVEFVARVVIAKLPFQEFKKALKEYPSPLANYYRQSLQNVEYNNMRLGVYSAPLVPRRVLFSEELRALLLVYAIGGVDKIDTAVAECRNLHDVLSVKSSGFVVKELSYAIFVDADDVGIAQRIQSINHHFAWLIGEPVEENGGSVRTNHGELFGCYVFHKNGRETGTVEDILLATIRPEHEQIREGAVALIKSGDPGLHECLANNAKRKKACVGILTQFFHPGSSMVVAVNAGKLFDEGCGAISDCRDGIGELIEELCK